MKKIIALILTALMVLSFAACSAGGEDGADTADSADAAAKVDGSVPVIKAGDDEITFAEFNLYFRTLPLSIAANYNYYFGDQYKEQLLAREGLDLDSPLKDQACPYIDGTYYDYFFNISKSRLTEIAALCCYAHENGVELEDSDREDIETRVSTIVSNSASVGTISDYYGDPLGLTTEAVVRSYYEKVSLAKRALSVFTEKLGIDEDDIAAEREANPDKYEDDYYTKTVRHILFMFDYYDTEEDCLAAAQAVLDEYLTDPTEEHFAELANEYSDDAQKDSEGNRTEKTDGGLYSNVLLGKTVAEFNDWIYDEARVPGDTEIIKSTYGYHIMYFVGDGELNDDGSATVESALTQKALDEYKETLGITFDDVFVENNID